MRRSIKERSMRIHLVALAMLTLFLNIGVAHASDARFAEGGKAVCTTTFKGDSFVGQAPTQESAEQAAMAACLKHGGNLNDCRANMVCEIKGNDPHDGDQDQTGDPDQDGDQNDPDQNGDQDQDGDQNQGQPKHKKAYYDWGRGTNGYGYCYQFTPSGHVMNGGHPQPNVYCERARPSHFNWGRSWNGFVYCYQWTPYLAIMNDGRPVPPGYCR